MSTSTDSPSASPPAEKLTGILGFIGTLGQPLGIQGPTASAYIVPVVMASLVGFATPLAFVLGLVIGFFVAYAFCLFASKYASAGSIYGFNRTALGPNYGFVSAWILFLGYMAFTAGSGPLCTLFLNALWPWWGENVSWPISSLIFMVLAGLLVYRSVSLSANFAAAVEFVGIAVLLVIGITVLAKGGYGGHNLTMKPFTTNGLSFSSLAFGVAFAFVGFAGFESAAVLGEESKDPKRAIPRAIMTGLLIAGVFVAFAAYVQVVGFKDATTLAADPSPLVTLSHEYVGGSFAGNLLTFVGLLSIFGAAISNLNASSRLLYAFGRDGIISGKLGHTHPKHGTPVVALVAVWVVCVATFLAMSSTTYVLAFTYTSTTAAIAMLLAYLSTVIAASVRFRRSAHILFPVLGIPSIAYVLYRQIWPVPASPLDWVIDIAFAWLVLGVIAVAVSPKLRRLLAASQELTLDDDEPEREPVLTKTPTRTPAPTASA